MLYVFFAKFYMHRGKYLSNDICFSGPLVLHWTERVSPLYPVMMVLPRACDSCPSSGGCELRGCSGISPGEVHIALRRRFRIVGAGMETRVRRFRHGDALASGGIEASEDVPTSRLFVTGPCDHRFMYMGSHHDRQVPDEPIGHLSPD